jgi:GalNAc-alpha-(1->4)-GalNAc-alpha-(1->3)-diNAcBac-PP-undecaprenol alpha-1,4-N-acetyl-D-galactosaminyltransferase
MKQYVRRRRVTFVIAHLGPGGAQRVAATAANALAEQGVEMHIITVLDNPPDSYTLDPRVQRHRQPQHGRQTKHSLEYNGSQRLNTDTRRSVGWFVRAVLNKTLRRPLRIAALGAKFTRQARWLRQTLNDIKPDAVLSFLTQTNILTVLATRGMQLRTIISERNDPRLQSHRQHVVLMRRLLYRWSDLVTANSRGAVEALREFVPKHKLAFLPNPLSLSNRSAIEFAEPTFITVTRLVEQKGIDVLLKAATEALEKLPGWRLAIVGDGPLSDDLRALSRHLGIAERVDWFGHVDDPIPYLKAAKFFVLTSRFEGSPNALLEAMACGLPAIVSDASPGPLELIGQEESGLIVPVEDAHATADAIVRLATDDGLREALGAQAIERTRSYQLESAIPVWLELLDGT